MTHRMKKVAGLVLGGLLVAGGAIAATTHPTLKPIGALREPTVVVQTYTGKLKEFGDNGRSMTITVTSPKKYAGDKVMDVSNGVLYYTRNGTATTAVDFQIGDEIKVWYLKHAPTIALKVWDRKIWTNSGITRTIADLAFAPTAEAPMTATFSLVKTGASTVYDVIVPLNTTIEKVGASGNTTAALTDLANGKSVRVTGLWNDAQKKLYATKIVIQ